NVRSVPACRTVLLSADRIEPGSFFSCPESVCRVASHASCVQRYGRRSALSTFLHRPVQDDVADQATLRRALKKNGVAASEICGRCSGMESIGSDCGLHIHTPAVGHPLLPLLLALFSVTVAISVAARSFLDGCHPRGDCQLVRSSIRIPELLNSR